MRRAAFEQCLPIARRLSRLGLSGQRGNGGQFCRWPNDGLGERARLSLQPARRSRSLSARLRRSRRTPLTGVLADRRRLSAHLRSADVCRHCRRSSRKLAGPSLFDQPVKVDQITGTALVRLCRTRAFLDLGLQRGLSQPPGGPPPAPSKTTPRNHRRLNPAQPWLKNR